MNEIRSEEEMRAAQKFKFEQSEKQDLESPEEISQEASGDLDNILSEASAKVESGIKNGDLQQIADGLEALDANPSATAEQPNESDQVSTTKGKLAGFFSELKLAMVGGEKGKKIFSDFGADVAEAARTLAEKSDNSLKQDAVNVIKKLYNKWGLGAVATKIKAGRKSGQEWPE